MKELKLHLGQIVLVDDDDFEWLNQWQWGYSKSNGYAIRQTRNRKEGLYKVIYMHRSILEKYFEPIPSLVVDHINHNKLDNRLTNLRLVTRQQNAWNSYKPKNNQSGAKGVCWRPRLKKWEVNMKINGTYQYLGVFSSKSEAINTYKNYEKMIRGEFVPLN